MAYEQHGGSVVPVGEEGREEALALFEAADTEAIIAHLSTGGVELEDFVYSFPIEGREVVGISWAGAKEIARQLGNIEVLREIKVEDRDGAFYGLVWVRDIARNVTILGAARQPKEKTLKSGAVKPDEHAFVVAINKAQRNGILALVDEAVKQRLVSVFLQGHKKAVKRGVAPPPPPHSTSPGPSKNGVSSEVPPGTPATIAPPQFRNYGDVAEWLYGEFKITNLSAVLASLGVKALPELGTPQETAQKIAAYLREQGNLGTVRK